ncbi:hypothetical protein ACFQE1_12825 [Halobium palmae]|uniref:Uncharacterized protein n=1 Tax=Halobium palmae TaxID=1776492 RepID=A0ABD5S152_9EURY
MSDDRHVLRRIWSRITLPTWLSRRRDGPLIRRTGELDGEIVVLVEWSNGGTERLVFTPGETQIRATNQHCPPDSPGRVERVVVDDEYRGEVQVVRE